MGKGEWGGKKKGRKGYSISNGRVLVRASEGGRDQEAGQAIGKGEGLALLLKDYPFPPKVIWKFLSKAVVPTPTPPL